MITLTTRICNTMKIQWQDVIKKCVILCVYNATAFFYKMDELYE